MNIILFVLFGLIYSAVRVNYSYATEPGTGLGTLFQYILIYFAPNIVLFLGTIRLALVNKSSREIYVGIYVIYAFLSELIYLIDFSIGESWDFLVLFVLIVQPLINIYAFVIDKSIKKLFDNV